MNPDYSTSDFHDDPENNDQNDNDIEYSVSESRNPEAPPVLGATHKRAQSQSINFFMPATQSNYVPVSDVTSSSSASSSFRDLHSVSTATPSVASPPPPSGGPTPPAGLPKPRGKCITIHERSAGAKTMPKAGSATLSRQDSRSTLEHRGSISISHNEHRNSISSNGTIETSVIGPASTTKSRLTRAPSEELSVSRNSPSISVESGFHMNTMTSPSRNNTRTSFSVGSTPMASDKKICKYNGCRSFVSTRHCVSLSTMASTPEDPEPSTLVNPEADPEATSEVGSESSPQAASGFESSRGAFSPIAPSYCLRHMYKHSLPDIVPTNPKRWAAMYELLTTEESYVSSLKSFQLEYISRLNVLVELGIPVITADDVNRIFRNLPDIIDVNGQFLDDLLDLYGSKDERAILEAVPLLLQHYSSLFSVYRSYLESYDSASAHASALLESNQKFVEFVNINNKILRLTLHDYLIMPVQRIPRYLLLLREIMRNIPDTDSVMVEYSHTFDLIDKIASKINTGLSDQEHEIRLRHFMSKVEQDVRYFDLAAPGRRIIIDGPLKVRNTDSSSFSRSAVFHFVLCNDVLVYFIERGSFRKTYRMRHILKLDKMAVSPSMGPNNKDKDLIIEASTKEGEKKKYNISCGTTENRNSWVSALMKAIVAHENILKEASTKITSKKLAAIL